MPTPQRPPARDLRRASERYESRQRIGLGAMGTVHVCRDRRIGRDIAIKAMREENACDVAARVRFAREARVQGKLEHPAILPVYDMGEGPDGALFFTMKRVEGKSLRNVLTGLQRNDPEMVASYGTRRLLEAFGTVCLAVAFAHSKGVIHRDIKPGNIMLGDCGQVYLLDWGVAKIGPTSTLPFDDSDDTTPSDAIPRGDHGTPGNEVAGTVGYMAPEQLLGEPISEAADIYALGATLFELLALIPLHARDSGPALESTINGADARIHLRAPGRKVDADLEALCVRATARRPEDRPASAREMHDAIAAVLDRERDVTRCRELAAELAARGREEAHRALQGGIGCADARSRALRAVHRSLALDPTEPGAIEVLSRLALEPSDRAEAQTDDELLETTRAASRMLARTGAALFAAWLGGLALVTALGIRSRVGFVMATLPVVAGFVLAWYRSRLEAMWVSVAALLVADIAAASAGAMFGPFVLAPGLLASTTLTFTIATWPWNEPLGTRVDTRLLRRLAVATGLVAFLVPILLEAAGVLPPSLELRDGVMVILPRAVDFPPGATLAVLTLLNATVLVVPALIAARVRDHALRVERRTAASASHLRDLLPWDTQAVMRAQHTGRITGTVAPLRETLS